MRSRRLALLTALLVVCSLGCGASRLLAASGVELTMARAAGVSYEVARRPFAGPSDPRDAYVLDVTFAPMTRSQFDALTAAYGGTGLVPWHEGERYSLADFLPPKMQALLGLRFEVVTEREVPWVRESFYEYSGESSIYTCSNCYCTVWEVARGKRLADAADRDTFCLFWVGEQAMSALLTDPAYGTVVDEAELRPGDVALFFEGHDGWRNLLHAAVYLDSGLYFEKTDTYDEYAWRLAAFEDMKAKLGEACSEGPEKLVVEYRRLNGTFPHPRDAFGVGPEDPDVPAEDRGQIVIGIQSGLGGRDVPGVYRIGEVDVVVDGDTGRCVLDPRSPLLRSFKSLEYETPEGTGPAGP